MTDQLSITKATSSRSGGENLVEDYITRRVVPLTPKEKVRQRVAEALENEYHLSPDDMLPDFPIQVRTPEGKVRRKRVEIAIFASGQEKTVENLRRAVVIRPEPKNGLRAITKLRNHEQAAKDLEELEAFMDAGPACDYGLWTNGLDFFFIRKDQARFETRYEALADWPAAEEHISIGADSSRIRLRRANAEMLRITFLRCYNFIHGNEGMSKDVAFWQFLYLIFAKIRDEQRPGEPLFYAYERESFEAEGRKRIDRLFAEVKKEYGPGSKHPIFRGDEEITLSTRVLGFLVSELARYNLTDTDIDAKGIAYQEFVGANLRVDRGQYFTPRGVVRLMVEILDPQEHEKVLDPACGAGSFLRETSRYQLERWRKQNGEKSLDTGGKLGPYNERLRSYVEEKLYGADFDQFLVWVTNLNLLLVAGTTGNVYHLDSLAFPKGHLEGITRAKREIKLGSIDVLMTNPPFGSDISINDPLLLDHYRSGVARTWRRDKDGHLIPSDTPVGSAAPEVLFLQRSIEWLHDGGRLGIVLPDGLLSNPGDEGIRRWIMQHCWVLASIDLPLETFSVDAGVNFLTTLLFLKKKTVKERQAEALRGGPFDYPIFMAVAEKVGVDRRGNTIYRTGPDGEDIWVEQDENSRVSRNGQGRHPRRTRIEDNDLPEIGRRYREFRTQYPEPGLTTVQEHR